MDRTSTHTRRNTPAFSLIELLAVIAVIGLLASVLIAAVAKVKEAAGQVKAVRNIRTVGEGILLYTQEHGGTIPAVSNQNIPAPRIWLFILMHEGYLTDPIAQQNAAGGWVHGDQLETLYNPATRDEHPEAYNAGGWGINGFENINRTHNIYTIEDTARTVLAADAYYNAGNDVFAWAISGLGTWGQYPNTFNGQSAYYLFCDAHVERIDAQVPGQVNSPPVGAGESVLFLIP